VIGLTKWAAYAGRAAGQMGIDLITLAQEALAGLD